MNDFGYLTTLFHLRRLYSIEYGVIMNGD